MIGFFRRIGAKFSSLVIQFLVRRAARNQGFLDPFPVMERLRHLAQPSEVNEPIELLRAAAVFHARGLINSRAIQHNLDWVWPFWVHRQFDPYSKSFITRGFSATHINLTHRNWTALGVPDCPSLPIVDPRGLVTPCHDSWSIDVWIIGSDGARRLIPSACETCDQQYALVDGHLQVVTTLEEGDDRLRLAVWVEAGDGDPDCVVRCAATSPAGGWLALSVRPYNPEGVSPIQSIQTLEEGRTWEINHRRRMRFGEQPARQAMSGYWNGDVSLALPETNGQEAQSCKAGLATAAALYPMAKETEQRVEVRVALTPPLRQRRKGPAPAQPLAEKADWESILARTPQLRIPDARMSRLYRQALYSLILHSPDLVYPGPFTYKRFWFRDASFILNALLNANLDDRVRRCLDHYPEHQTLSGYFHSQDGEWDSNGEALWILDQYYRTTGQVPDEQCLQVISKAADWIRRKRRNPRHSDRPHAGLLPSGFSAEHLGPNDYYYWDNFWSATGLHCAAGTLDSAGRSQEAERFRAAAAELMDSVEASVERCKDRRPGYPEAYAASPYRRMDSGAVGSIVASYPLQLLKPGDHRVRETMKYLLEHCMVKGGFFQENIHSGINAYLTLHMAQVLLRDGDPRFFELVETVADLASPTGQWPEAIHPSTEGGCMGDGHHVWASAEWFMMLRNMFLREEGQTLILLGGIPQKWLDGGEELSFGPAATLFGSISLRCQRTEVGTQVAWDYEPNGTVPSFELRLAGREPVSVADPVSTTRVLLGGASGYTPPRAGGSLECLRPA